MHVHRAVGQFNKAIRPAQPRNPSGSFGGKDLGPTIPETRSQKFPAAGFLGLGKGCRHVEALRRGPSGACQLTEGGTRKYQRTDKRGDRVSRQAKHRRLVPKSKREGPAGLQRHSPEGETTGFGQKG